MNLKLPNLIEGKFAYMASTNISSVGTANEGPFMVFGLGPQFVSESV